MAGWKRLALMGVMVCLPIPMLAASGLAVPLPSVVYRVAVGVAERTQAVAVRVPGLGAVVAETKQVARRGTIRLSPEELAVAHPLVQTTTATGTHRPAAADRARRSTGHVVGRPEPTKEREPAARTTKVKPKPVASPGTHPEPATRAVAAPDAKEGPRASDSPGREERPPEKRDSRPVENSSGGSAVGATRPPESRTTTPREEPRTSPPKEEPRNTTPDVDPLPPPPPRPTPPASVPPLAVTPPIDPLPDPVPLPPKAQLEEIAAELRKIAAKQDDNGGRVGQALEKVESAVERLEKTPPDNQGAVGDIKNAVQKLDAALAEGEIDVVQRTGFVTRLNTVSDQLKVGP
jgi:hypothetical protein